MYPSSPPGLERALKNVSSEGSSNQNRIRRLSCSWDSIQNCEQGYVLGGEISPMFLLKAIEEQKRSEGGGACSRFDNIGAKDVSFGYE